MNTQATFNNPLVELLSQNSQNILNIYFTAGYPSLDDTVVIMQSLKNAGADIIEIGMPFSDPLADGPTIQKANNKALKNGMSLKVLFQQLGNFPSKKLPTILMGYLNPVLQYGMEGFCKKCEEVGVSGVILPDLPVELYVSQYKALFTKHNLCNICLVTPQTTEERIRLIDSHTTGFIYAVSSASTTGGSKGIVDAQDYLKKLKQMNLKNPVLTGFNIKDRESFNMACQHTNGGIIGSAFIKHLEESGATEKSIKEFINKIK